MRGFVLALVAIAVLSLCVPSAEAHGRRSFRGNRRQPQVVAIVAPQHHAQQLRFVAPVHQRQQLILIAP
jgi:hypothetical protein